MECGKSLKIIDTNVIRKAGDTNYDAMTPLEALCAQCCHHFIKSFLDSLECCIVLDIQYDIIREYQRNIPYPPQGQPTIATSFMRKLLRNLSKIPLENWADTQKQKNAENLYGTFPQDKRLADFDPADRKFIAVANAHPDRPPIVEGTDCKWWGYKEILAEYGISIDFLCEAYIKDAYQKKIGKIEK